MVREHETNYARAEREWALLGAINLSSGKRKRRRGKVWKSRVATSLNSNEDSFLFNFPLNFSKVRSYLAKKSKRKGSNGSSGNPARERTERSLSLSV
jgi:hypothetical protein